MGLLATILGGPIMGLLGSITSAFFKEREAKAAVEAKKVDQAHELALLTKQAEIRGKEMENELAIAQADAVAKQVTASYAHDSAGAGKSYAWAEAVKTLFRPFITLILVLLSAGVYFTFDPLTMGLNPIQEHIIASVLFLTEVAVTWWFADRARETVRK
jgi:hypothetical protein